MRSAVSCQSVVGWPGKGNLAAVLPARLGWNVLQGGEGAGQIGSNPPRALQEESVCRT